MQLRHSRNYTGPESASSETGRAGAWLRRVGLIGVLFFTIKGLAWLTVPAVIAWWSTR